MEEEDNDTGSVCISMHEHQHGVNVKVCSKATHVFTNTTNIGTRYATSVSHVTVNKFAYIHIPRTCSILSGLGSMPGIMWAGLKAICSTSAKQFTGFRFKTNLPTGISGYSACGHTLEQTPPKIITSLEDKGKVVRIMPIRCMGWWRYSSTQSQPRTRWR